MAEKVRREHTRIIFGEGEGRWSVVDPDYPAVEEEFLECTERKLYNVRGLASQMLYLICVCPTTELAQKKIAAIRRALREVPNPYTVVPWWRRARLPQRLDDGHDGTTRGGDYMPDGSRVADAGWDESCMMNAHLVVLSPQPHPSERVDDAGEG